MKQTVHSILIILLLHFFCMPVSAEEKRVTQLFITIDGHEYRYTFLYDELGNIELETKYIQTSNDDWFRLSQTEWTRSADVITQHERVSDNNLWRDNFSIEIEHNAQGLKMNEIFFCFASGERMLIKTVQYDYADYNRLAEIREYRYVNGFLQPVLVQQFEQNGHVFIQWTIGTEKSFVSRTTYDDQGRPQSMLVQREIGNIVWSELVKTDSITWFYNDYGQLISQRSRRWNERGEHWENTQMINFEYDAAGNLIAETYLQWSGMHWQNMYRREFQHNVNNVKIRRTLQGHIHRDWRNMISIHYGDIRNGKAREIWSEFDFWGGNTGELTPSYIPFYFNDELVIRRAERIQISFDSFISDLPTLNPNQNDLIIQVYPNPSDGRFYLSTTKHDILSWQVFSVTGQMVKSQNQTTNSAIIDLTKLPQGVYVLHVQTAAGTEQKRLIKR